jgi:proline iminopeptidase
VPLHVRDDGPAAAPAIVFLAGLGMTSADWPAALVDGLAQDFRVLRLDNRDAGRSPRCGPDPDPGATGTLRSGKPAGKDPAPYHLGDMAEDVLAALDARGIGRCALVGFSMGGMIAQAVALAAPERVAALVLVATAAGPGPFAPDVHARFVRMCEPFEDAAALRAWLREDIAFFHAPCVPDAEARRRMADDMLAGGLTQGGFARQYRAILATPDWRAGLRRIACPSLILCGAEDICLPPSHARALAAALPRADLRIVDGVGHSLEPGLVAPIPGWLRRKARTLVGSSAG